MNLDEFLDKLHYETEKVVPPDWEPNWDDAPLPYKLYRGLPVIELPSQMPDTLTKRNAKPNLKDISHFLKFSYGLTQVSHSMPFTDQPDSWTMSRRFVPSGGALYPNELYVYLKIDDIPNGIYHYDSAHHRLVCLREGNFDEYLKQALGNRCEISNTFATVFVSTFFWKNFFKYHNFSYRLQALDAGFLIGQVLETGKQLGFDSGVYYHFLDDAILHLLGLNDQEESVYAVIPLSVEKSMNWFMESDSTFSLSAKTLCHELPELHHHHYMRSKEIRDYSMLLTLNKACKLTTFPSDLPYIKQKDESYGTPIKLPAVDRLTYDFLTACRSRYSPGMDFVLKPVSEHTLSSLLFETSESSRYRNDLDGARTKKLSRISLNLCTYNIDGVPDGAYTYDGIAHRLNLISSGDFRNTLQQGLLSDFVNTAQIPLAFTMTGEKDHYHSSYGYRGHRIQHMEVGLLSHRLILAASALKMGGHPILGFDVSWYDKLYRSDQKGKISLLHIPIGYYRSHPRLQGSLHT